MLKYLNKFVCISFVMVLFVSLAVPSLHARSAATYKVALGMPFVYFDIEDVFHQRWVSTYLRGTPVIILTGHRSKRYEILQWAEALKRDFGASGAAHVLWVVNLKNIPWSTSRGTIVEQWRRFNAPIPVLLDWHGTIGKATRIDYNLPNIIVLDSDSRLVMHEKCNFSPEVYNAIAARIRTLTSTSTTAAKPAVQNPVEPAQTQSTAPMPPDYAPPPMSAQQSGKRGDSY